MRLANLVCFLMAGGPLVPGDESEKDTMASIRANYPMSPIDTLGAIYYFEVRIEKSVEPQ